MKSNLQLNQGKGSYMNVSSNKRQSLLLELLQYSNEKAKISPVNSPRSEGSKKRSSSLSSPTSSEIKKDKQLYKQVYSAVLNHDLGQINEIITQLEQQDKDINSPIKTKSLDEKNMLHLVVESLDEKDAVLKFLVEEKNADVNAQDAIGNTPLLLACRAGKLTAVQYLLTKGADLHAQNKIGDYCMCFAAYSGNAELVRFLLSLKVDFLKVNQNKQSPVNIAFQQGSRDIIAILTSYSDTIRA